MKQFKTNDKVKLVKKCRNCGDSYDGADGICGACFYGVKRKGVPYFIK